MLGEVLGIMKLVIMGGIEFMMGGLVVEDVGFEVWGLYVELNNI
jgi:hypothetical protein